MGNCERLARDSLGAGVLLQFMGGLSAAGSGVMLPAVSCRGASFFLAVSSLTRVAALTSRASIGVKSAFSLKHAYNRLYRVFRVLGISL